MMMIMIPYALLSAHDTRRSAKYEYAGEESKAVYLEGSRKISFGSRSEKDHSRTTDPRSVRKNFWLSPTMNHSYAMPHKRIRVSFLPANRKTRLGRERIFDLM